MNVKNCVRKQLKYLAAKCLLGIALLSNALCFKVVNHSTQDIIFLVRNFAIKQQQQQLPLVLVIVLLNPAIGLGMVFVMMEQTIWIATLTVEIVVAPMWTLTIAQVSNYAHMFLSSFISYSVVRCHFQY